jgi:hypothetical protein
MMRNGRTLRTAPSSLFTGEAENGDLVYSVRFERIS